MNSNKRSSNCSASKSKEAQATEALLEVMARLRAPDGCPWDREQDHFSLRYHAVEEVYELLDSIEARDDHEMAEELGDLLLQVVFHCQLARERGAFDYAQVAQNLVEKLIRRHPHVFSNSKVSSVAGVWSQWEKIKRQEKEGTHRERTSAFDGIPKHLPALMRAGKLVKRAQKCGLANSPVPSRSMNQKELGAELFELARYAEQRGWSAEALLRNELKRQERAWRRKEGAGKNQGTKRRPFQ